MDWLDQYLDGMGNYKTTVSPADTHMWGAKPKLNSTQQRMIFDAAAQSELEYRQLIKEARSDLEAHGMSHEDVAEGIGADPGSPAVQLVTPPVPAGISLTAPTIYGSGLTLNNGFSYTTNGSMNNPYTLTSPGNWIDSSAISIGRGRVIYSEGWQFLVSALLFGFLPTAVIVARNTASPASLPTSGWVNENGALAVTGTLVISTAP